MTEIEKLGPDDLQKLKNLIRLYEDVFEMQNFVMPGDEYLQSLLIRDGVTFLVATIDGAIAGGLTAHDLPSTYFEANEVYVYDLAVKTEHQRKGIGSSLLQELARRCKQNGESEFFVQADLDDQHAVDFYRSTGGLAESVIHFSYDTRT